MRNRTLASMIITSITFGWLLLVIRPESPQAHTRPGAVGGFTLPPPRPSLARPGMITARVTVSTNVPGQAIPRSFLGISTEYWALPQWAHQLPLLYRVLSMIRGPGALVLRIGGDSADRTFWAPDRDLPDWAYATRPGWLREVSRIIHHTQARIILDLNLVTGSPASAARSALAAVHALPPGSIAGWEIGNEPDLYGRAGWEATLDSEREDRDLPAAITPADYAHAYLAYQRALAALAPGVPLLGPAVALPVTHLAFVRDLLDGPHPGLGAVTVHRYPFTACARPRSAAFPTISRVLSPRATAGLVDTLRPALALARSAGLPLRLTELNSVTCGGRAGVSNAFATALWAPDALFSLVRAGVASADIHVRADAVNAAFAIGRHGLSAHPLLYGLATFARMLGPNAKLLTTRITASARTPLSAWAVRSGTHTLRVLLLDEGPDATRVTLQIPGSGPGRIERLTAPAVTSTSGVTLGGRWLGADARWHGASTQTVASRDSTGATVWLPRYSGAIVSFSDSDRQPSRRVIAKTSKRMRHRLWFRRRAAEARAF